MTYVAKVLMLPKRAKTLAELGINFRFTQISGLNLKVHFKFLPSLYLHRSAVIHDRLFNAWYVISSFSSFDGMMNLYEQSKSYSVVQELKL